MKKNSYILKVASTNMKIPRTKSGLYFHRLFGQNLFQSIYCLSSRLIDNGKVNNERAKKKYATFIERKYL